MVLKKEVKYFHLVLGRFVLRFFVVVGWLVGFGRSTLRASERLSLVRQGAWAARQLLGATYSLLDPDAFRALLPWPVLRPHNGSNKLIPPRRHTLQQANRHEERSSRNGVCLPADWTATWMDGLDESWMIRRGVDTCPYPLESHNQNQHQRLTK